MADREPGGHIGHLVGEIARLPEVAGGGAFAGKRGSAARQIAVDDAIDQTVGERRRRGDRLSGRAHLERKRQSGEPWQPLRAASAGNDAEQHFGLADLRVGHRHPEVAGHGHFIAAAERVPVDRRDQRLGTVLETGEQSVRRRGSL